MRKYNLDEINFKLEMIKMYKNWTWKQLAKHFGVSSRFLNYFRKGERTSHPLAQKINRSFGQMFKRTYLFTITDRGHGYYFAHFSVHRGKRSAWKKLQKLKAEGVKIKDFFIGGKTMIKGMKEMAKDWDVYNIDEILDILDTEEKI